MAMGRKQARQQSMWEMPARSPGHPFYEKLNALLNEASFDEAVEKLSAPHYGRTGERGGTSTPPGVYFRMLLIGYFEGIESERGIEWRCTDSLSLKEFLGVEGHQRVPDHSSLSRTRKRLPAEVFDQVFQLVLGLVESKGLLKGKVAGVDSTYLRADASMKAIVSKKTGEEYREYVLRLARESGLVEPTIEEAVRLDRRRKGKKTSNANWKSSTDPDARIARLKDGRTRLAYKPEHVVDLETGANISVEVFPADESDASTLKTSLKKAKENIEVVKTSDDDDDPPAATSRRNEVKMEVVADKGYHKAELLLELKAAGFRTYIPERNQAGQRHWQDKGGERTARAVYQNRARVSRKKSKALQRRRGELVERPFAHICETGGHRRTRLRGIENMKKRYVIQVAGANLGLIMRTLHRWGTPRGLADAGRAALWLLYALSATWSALRRLFRARPYPQPARVIAPVLTGRMVAVSTGC
jgi:transposase